VSISVDPWRAGFCLEWSAVRVPPFMRFIVYCSSRVWLKEGDAIPSGWKLNFVGFFPGEFKSNDMLVRSDLDLLRLRADFGGRGTSLVMAKELETEFISYFMV
jgi:hypothetical protein